MCSWLWKNNKIFKDTETELPILHAKRVLHYWSIEPIVQAMI